MWDLALVRDETTLISCGAEGAVKVWDVSGPSAGHLKLTWGWHGLDSGDSEENHEGDVPGATAVEALKVDLKQVAVAYQNAVIKIFEIENGKEISRLASDSTYGMSSSDVHSESMLISIQRWDTGHSNKSDSVASNDASACDCSRGQVLQNLRY